MGPFSLLGEPAPPKEPFESSAASRYLAYCLVILYTIMRPTTKQGLWLACFRGCRVSLQDISLRSLLSMTGPPTERIRWLASMDAP